MWSATCFAGDAARAAPPGSARLAAIMEQEEIAPSDLIGLNTVGGLLGSGAFGKVKKVHWRKTPAAAKVAHDSIQQEQKQLFLRELELMVRCRHPNIVQFLGYVDNPFVIVMEYLPCGDLRAYWETRRVSNSHKAMISLDVLRALAYLHNRKPSSIIHRDIKPTNVLMTRSGMAKLTDFGLGKLMSGEDGSKHSGQSGREDKCTRRAETLSVDAPHGQPAPYDQPTRMRGPIAVCF